MSARRARRRVIRDPLSGRSSRYTGERLRTRMISSRNDHAASSLGFLLSQVGVYAARRFAQRIAALDLQPPLFRVLNAVDFAEGQSQQAIGEAIGAPPSRMVAIVDELEQRGLVDRRPHPSDRRIRALYLTDDGREL